MAEALRTDVPKSATPLDAWLTVTEFASHWPSVELSAVTENGGRAVDVPQAAIDLFDNATVGGRLLDVVVPASMVAVVDSFQRSRSQVGARCQVFFKDRPRERRPVYFFNLQKEFQLVLVVVLPAGDSAKHVSESSDEPPVASRVMVHTVDEASHLQSIDDLTRRTLGWTDAVLHKSSLEFVHPDDHESAIKAWIEMLDHTAAVKRRVRLQHADGHWLWFEVTNYNCLDSLGVVRREVVDITDEMLALETVRTNRMVLQGLAESLPSGIAQFDAALEPVFRNGRWDAIIGAQEFPTVTVLNAMFGGSQPVLQREGWVAGQSFDREISLEPLDGSEQRRVRVHVVPLIDDDDGFAGLVCCLEDVTESWKLQQTLAHQARSDSLTGLANRSNIVETLDSALKTAKSAATLTAVLFVDLNGFKRVNDQFGHSGGDRLLTMVAERFQQALRPGDRIGRQGGDEFVVVCSNIATPGAAIQVGRRLLAEANEIRILEGHRIELQASCGISLDHAGTATAEQLISEADLAMYEHKRDRSPEPVLFRKHMFEEQRLELRRDSALEVASIDGSLAVHYQPVVSMVQNRLVGFEALARWSFEGAPVGPDVFIAAAERRGLIDRIGNWMLDQVLADAAATPQGKTWSINVSPYQLRDPEFCDRVMARMDANGVSPKNIAFEITEGVPIEDSGLALKTLLRLHELGFLLVVDDFGTGFASLDYLRALPVGAVKIDRSFTADLDQPRTLAIVENLVTLADGLNLKLVVEGVETAEQQQLLVDVGADLGQGYFFGRPAPLSSQPLLSPRRGDAARE